MSRFDRFSAGIGPLGSARSKAFSLVEVVLALAVFVFVGFALVGLLGVGLQSSSDSRERTQAATIMEKICSVRRAAPTNDFTPSSSPEPNFPLPVLDQPSPVNNLTAPLYLTRDGQTTTRASATFGFIYTITPLYNTVPAGNSTSGVAQVYACLFWPPAASPSNANTGRYEIATTFNLP